MITVEAAFECLDGFTKKISLATESVPTIAAHGRTLAADQVSLFDLPPFNKSAMDGYALPQNDVRESYQILETVAAGAVCTQPLTAGTATKVMTGAPVPVGAGNVVMIEKTTEKDGVVFVHSHGGGDNICLQGEDVKTGEKILSKGIKMDATHIGHLISCGVIAVPVLRKTKIAILTTGDEIVDDPAQIQAGKIMNSNGAVLGALAEKAGLEIVTNCIVADRLCDTKSALDHALEEADLIVFSGGVSVGEFDFVRAALAENNCPIHFSKLAAKPGKPMTFATHGERLIFGLPGNPVSVFLMFHLFVLRAAQRLTGQNVLQEESLLLTEKITRKKTDRAVYIPAQKTAAGTVQEIHYNGSAHLGALIHADGWLLMLQGVSEIAAGEPCAFLPFIN
ncbi:MAG: molybdopterin molybdotransferase MoeA [Alphaproteobacteria bacterium]